MLYPLVPFFSKQKMGMSYRITVVLTSVRLQVSIQSTSKDFSPSAFH